MGSPAAEAVPSAVLAAVAAEQLSRPDAYDHAAIEGDPPLHTALLEMLHLPDQRLLTGLLAGGHLEEHLLTQRLEYKRRKDAMHTALQENFADVARWTDPEGGFFLWVTLDNGVDTSELFEIALAYGGVAFIPGPAFSPSGRLDALRLGFASTPPDRIHEGIARLRRAIHKLFAVGNHNLWAGPVAALCPVTTSVAGERIR